MKPIATRSREARGRFGVASSVLAVGILLGVEACVGSSPSTPGPSVPLDGIRWQAPVAVNTGRVDFGPYLASAGGQLFMLVKRHTTVTPADDGRVSATGGSVGVYSSTDGVEWTELPSPGPMDGIAAFPLAFAGDGHGGLVAVGNVVPVTGAHSTAVWHSADGRDWTQTQLPGEPFELLATASRPGLIVVLGRSETEILTWSSTDGNSWQISTLPDSDGFLPTALLAWKGGFTAIARDGRYGQYGSMAWTSTDGRVWAEARTELAGFGARSMVGLDDRIVVGGQRLGGPPVSWTSADGLEWSESVAPSGDASSMQAAAVCDGSIVAVGHEEMLLPAVTPPPGWTPPPPAATNVWISADGITWRLLPEDPAFQLSSSYDFVATEQNGRILVADPTASGVMIHLGDPVLGLPPGSDARRSG
jgi:hypothetical protein